MSEENVEIVRRLYNSAWMPGDFDLLPNILHPDIVWSAIESAPDAGTRQGYAGCRAYMEDWLEDFNLQPVMIEPSATTKDGLLVCSQRAVATGKGSGIQTEIRYGCTYRFSADGRIREIREYATTEDALEAAGLSE